MKSIGLKLNEILDWEKELMDTQENSDNLDINWIN